VVPVDFRVSDLAAAHHSIDTGFATGFLAPRGRLRLYPSRSPGRSTCLYLRAGDTWCWRVRGPPRAVRLLASAAGNWAVSPEGGTVRPGPTLEKVSSTPCLAFATALWCGRSGLCPRRGVVTGCQPGVGGAFAMSGGEYCSGGEMGRVVVGRHRTCLSHPLKRCGGSLVWRVPRRYGAVARACAREEVCCHRRPAWGGGALARTTVGQAAGSAAETCHCNVPRCVDGVRGISTSTGRGRIASR
jgi:hypothetical protein